MNISTSVGAPCLLCCGWHIRNNNEKDRLIYPSGRILRAIKFIHKVQELVLEKKKNEVPIYIANSNLRAGTSIDPKYTILLYI